MFGKKEEVKKVVVKEKVVAEKKVEKVEVKKAPVVKTDEVSVYNGKELARVFKGKRALKVATSWAAERGFIVK